jgi:hypothetical protein
MKKLILLIFATIGFNQAIVAQELYVFTEPASNMPTKAIGVRLTNEGMFSPDFRSRSIAEIMMGLNKNLMFHAQGFLSDMDGKYRVEGASLYVKYRFLTLDDTHSHFRGAAYGRVSSSRRNVISEDINLEGDTKGWQGGVVFTQLIHKLALSANLSYSKAFENAHLGVHQAHGPDQMLNYSLSSGYLVLPFVYKNYNQPNFNLYFEILGRTNPTNGHSALDFAPAVQLILNSKTRVDLGYRFQAAGNIQNRFLKNMYLARVEFNFFNALK